MESIIIIVIFVLALLLALLTTLNTKISKKKQNLKNISPDGETLDLEILQKEIDKLSRMVDFSSEAVVTVNKNLEFDQTYDKNMLKIGASNIDLKKQLYELREDVESIFHDVFLSKSKQAFLSHLPTQLETQSKRYRLNYKFSEADNLIYIYISDVTENSVKFNTLAKRNSSLEMVLQVIKYKQTYAEVIDFFDNKSFERIEQIFQKTDNIKMFKWELSRLLLTVKENLRQLGLIKSLLNLENLENDLLKLNSLEELSAAIWNISQDTLSDIIKEDRETIAGYVTEEHYIGKFYPVEMALMQKIEHTLMNLPDSDEKSKLQSYIADAKMGELNSIIKEFNVFAREKSQRLYKKINPLSITLSPTAAHNPNLSTLVKSAFGLIDNAIKYGISSPADRFRMGKPEKGTIKIGFFSDDEYLSLRVEDDGKGLEEEFFRTHTKDYTVVGGVHFGQLNELRSTDLHVLANEVKGEIFFESKAGEFTIVTLRVKNQGDHYDL